MLSTDPGKRALERGWLLWTPFWGAVTGVVMLGGFAEGWGDVELMVFGVVLAAGTLFAAVFSAPPEERARPWTERTGVKAFLAVSALSFGLNYLQTPFFFDVLHMRYGFRASWVIERNPVFLYLVTIAYFATYSVLGCVAFRLLSRSLGRAGAAAAYLIVPVLLALLETALNANPLMTRLFCYGEPGLMFGFGSLAYGVALALALPGWIALDETPAARTPLARALLWVVLALALDTGAVALLRYGVAPHLTVVEDPSAPGWDAQGCLARE